MQAYSRLEYDSHAMTTERGGAPPKTGLFVRLGVLRSLLIIAAVFVVGAAPFADGSVYMHDWRLLPSVIAPTVMMMLVFAIPLDITMARVFMADADAEERTRLRFAIRVDVIALFAMCLAWAPFMAKVLDFSPFTGD